MNKLFNYQQNHYVSLLNHGIFVTNLTVKYIHCGRSYSFDSGAFTLGFSRQITIPDNTTNIFVSAQVAVYTDFWEEIFCKTYKTVDKLCLLAYGIIWDRVCIEIPCTSNRICHSSNCPICY